MQRLTCKNTLLDEFNDNDLPIDAVNQFWIGAYKFIIMQHWDKNNDYQYYVKVLQREDPPFWLSGENYQPQPLKDIEQCNALILNWLELQTTIGDIK